jgi:hypothetical protein
MKTTGLRFFNLSTQAVHNYRDLSRFNDDDPLPNNAEQDTCYQTDNSQQHTASRRASLRGGDDGQRRACDKYDEAQQGDDIENCTQSTHNLCSFGKLSCQGFVQNLKFVGPL